MRAPKNFGGRSKCWTRHGLTRASLSRAARARGQHTLADPSRDPGPAGDSATPLARA